MTLHEGELSCALLYELASEFPSVGGDLRPSLEELLSLPLPLHTMFLEFQLGRT